METKVCNKCKKEKTLDNFTLRKDTGKYRCVCHECRRIEYHSNKKTPLERANKYYQEHKEEIKEKAKIRRRNHKEIEMWKSAKARAIKKNIPFSIEVKDVIIPKVCPVLGIPIMNGDGKPIPNSPSLDRIIPEKGYVKGNVIVVSQKANTIKNDATIDELKKVVDFYEKIM